MGPERRSVQEASSALPARQSDHPHAGPAAFAFEYLWQAGSLPPPHHYRYSIRGSTAGQGRIEFVPGYDRPGVPTWVEAFDIDGVAGQALSELLQAEQVMHRQWRQGSPAIGVGGSHYQLCLSNGTQRVELPSPLTGADATLADTLARMITALVPEAVWADLRQRHAAYLSTRG